jgi:hypothetical protein
MIILRILIKITRQSLPIIFAIALELRSFLGYPALAQIQISTLFSYTPPKPPHEPRPTSTAPAGGQNQYPQPTPSVPAGEQNPYTPLSPDEPLEDIHPPEELLAPDDVPRTLPPDNKPVPGGGLNPSNSSCKSTSKSLTALIPIKNPVLTTRQHPTFLFYVPYTSDEVRFGEFSLLVGLEEKTRLYKARFTLPQTPGIVSLTLPSKPEYALEEGEFYHWYFELYCQTNTSSQLDLDVNGWVQRVALTPERERQINAATPDIWYDASVNLAESLRTSPQNAKLRNDWLNLLKFIGSEDLAQEPFVGSVIPLQYPAVPRRRRQEVILSEGLSR